ncbi:hypothetical protein [Microbacterium sp. SLBN-146]|uniref:hypothetical protein n=1 Tax=Microbacterium sp. SLBN-146 TaxID=2768457 RepID=UPI00114E3EEA|nr:hypothetical protein [Microbacterium sp. SLBN-146]TQJ31069.1 hypothetical protein FBY39_1529 [Microbacterium sp. SLBN-146]
MSNPRGRRFDPIHLVDVLVYLVVLGLFTQFFPSVISESFSVSLITAILLKLALELVVRAKSAVITRFRAAASPVGKVLLALALVATGAGSKFLVLWLTDLLLGDAVHLGGFFLVTVLVITLVLSRTGVRLLLQPRAAVTREIA